MHVMATYEELRAVRMQKMQLLVDAGMAPFAGDVERDYPLVELVKQFTDLQNKNAEVSVAGRIMSIRGQGAILFVSLFDGTEKFQVVFKKDEIDENLFNLFTDAIDIGDFIQVTGSLFVTKAGQNSLLVTSWKILTKGLLALPDKWHGLQDVEETQRKRYLDILMDEETRNRFIIRSKIVTYKIGRAHV